MKRIYIILILIAFAVLALVSCEGITPITPIEKYGGGEYVIIEYDNTSWRTSTELYIKNKDTMFWIRVHNFDVTNYNVGDTIK